MHLLEYFKTDKGEHGTCNSIGRDYPYSGYKQNIEIRNKYPPHFLPHKRKTPTETTNIEEIEKKLTKKKRKRKRERERERERERNNEIQNKYQTYHINNINSNNEYG